MTSALQKLKVFIVATILVVGGGAAHGETKASAPDSNEDPARLVVRLAQNVIEAARADNSVQAGDTTAVRKLVEERILPYVDFEKTTRLAAGRAWRQATPEQRTQLTSEFRTLLIHTYAGALGTARDYKVRVVLSRKQGEDEALVRTEVVAPRGGPIQLDYRLATTDAGWKIYDVSVLGVWLVQTYHTSFANEVSQGGIERLISSLAARNRQNAAPRSS
jgi:phospholipid transport system substrate-binding protein